MRMRTKPGTQEKKKRRCDESEKSLDVDATSQSNMVLQQETFSFKRTPSYLGSLKRGLMER